MEQSKKKHLIIISIDKFITIKYVEVIFKNVDIELLYAAHLHRKPRKNKLIDSLKQLQIIHSDTYKDVPMIIFFNDEYIDAYNNLYYLGAIEAQHPKVKTIKKSSLMELFKDKDNTSVRVNFNDYVLKRKHDILVLKIYLYFKTFLDHASSS